MNTVNQISFQIGPNRIISFNSTKYLRIFIDSDLKLYNHIKYILYFINLLFQLESYLLWGIMLIQPSLIKIYYSFAYDIFTLGMEL